MQSFRLLSYRAVLFTITALCYVLPTVINARVEPLTSSNATSPARNDSLLGLVTNVTHSNAHKSHVSGRVLQDGDTGLGSWRSWTTSKKDFVYSEGFVLRLLVVIFLCIVVALVLVFVRGLKDRKTKDYGSLNNQMFEEKAAARLVYVDEDSDDEEIPVFEASKHKLLAAKD